MPSHAENVREYFRLFAEVYAPTSGSPLYECLSYGVADDEDMLEFAAQGAENQPAANLLYAAVHFLLLEGAQHPLRAYYPDVTDAASAPDDETYAHFRDFVQRYRAPLAALLKSRLVQTNVVRRSACLVHAFAEVSRDAGGLPLATIEIGSSAGLNLRWDQFRYAFEAAGCPPVHWGPEDSLLKLAAEVRGDVALPALPEGLSVAWRAGVDVNPIDLTDPTERQWLRALIFPEHVERHHELEAAAQIAAAHPVFLVAGDANACLPELIAKAPDDAALCLYATVVLYQFSKEAVGELSAGLRAASAERPIWFISMDGTADGAASLTLRTYRDGEKSTRELATVHPHGRWLSWCG